MTTLIRRSAVADVVTVHAVIGFGGVLLAALAMSPARRRWIVLGAVVLELIVAFVWTFFAWFAAMPCGLSGTGILEPTPQCPVETGHFVSVIVGGTSCLALFVSIAAGLIYANGGREGTRRVFQVAL